MQPELEQDEPPRRLRRKGQVPTIDISRPEEEEASGEEEVVVETPLSRAKLQQSLMDPFMDFKGRECGTSVVACSGISGMLDLLVLVHDSALDTDGVRLVSSRSPLVTPMCPVSWEPRSPTCPLRLCLEKVVGMNLRRKHVDNPSSIDQQPTRKRKSVTPCFQNFDANDQEINFGEGEIMPEVQLGEIIQIKSVTSLPLEKEEEFQKQVSQDDVTGMDVDDEKLMTDVQRSMNEKMTGRNDQENICKASR
ncbi:hypothetical protein GOP47_0002659 [Adiantum capillus-veneris]|uniref:Uncharacterized protein n=1 Tax=Adiantum capillus-veneris TaxID=13818 RepID=A0A9D4ZR53_ADICA|nr:hypothetical protein GOP47_0002659 [Adiantum capillus-veneris]